MLAAVQLLAGPGVRSLTSEDVGLSVNQPAVVPRRQPWRYSSGVASARSPATVLTSELANHLRPFYPWLILPVPAVWLSLRGKHKAARGHG